MSTQSTDQALLDLLVQKIGAPRKVEQNDEGQIVGLDLSELGLFQFPTEVAELTSLRELNLRILLAKSGCRQRGEGCRS